MMKTIVEEKRVSFKTLEQKIFSYVCELRQRRGRLGDRGGYDQASV